MTDNGVGLPKENRSRLAEPYMTTRAKGTGLGLAIVKRVIEEHGGKLRLDDAPSGTGRAGDSRICSDPGACTRNCLSEFVTWLLTF